jgi:hypothetical protein
MMWHMTGQYGRLTCQYGRDDVAADVGESRVDMWHDLVGW